MPATNISQQQSQLNRLRDELNRLNGLLAEQKQKLGLNPGDDIVVDPAQVTPELARAMKAAQLEAEKAGRNAAASLLAESTGSGGAHRPRRGSIFV